MVPPGAIRIGSRGSKLALWQARHVAGRLSAIYPDLQFPIVVIQTTADRQAEVPLSAIGDKSLFIKEIETALINGSIELAVHSLKDVPSRLDQRFCLAAILEREDPRDVLLLPESPKDHPQAAGPAAADELLGPVRSALSALPANALIGTSSLRREAQLRAVRRDLRFASIRGNVDTRLRKLEERQYDAILLAAAGLHRLAVEVPSHGYLDPAVCTPAPGQAALCVEALIQGTAKTLAAVLDDPDTRLAVTAERAFAAALDAGCQVPLGAYARLSAAQEPGDRNARKLQARQELGPKSDGLPPSSHPLIPGANSTLLLRTVVASPDGTRIVRASSEGTDPEALGREAAVQALGEGAAELLALARSRP